MKLESNLSKVLEKSKDITAIDYFLTFFDSSIKSKIVEVCLILLCFWKQVGGSRLLLQLMVFAYDSRGL